jgi:hypothetical protein
MSARFIFFLILGCAPVSQIAPVREVSTLIGSAIGGRLFAEGHLQSLPGLGSVSPRSLTIGFDGWLLSIIVLQSLSLVGRKRQTTARLTVRPISAVSSVQPKRWA